MNKVSLPHVKALLLAAGLGFLSPVFAQEVSKVGYQTDNILTGMCIPELKNLSDRSKNIIIEKGDSFSAIASKKGINYADFILFLKEFNPGINIHKINIGDEYKILGDGITQEEINTYRSVLQKKGEFEQILQLWEDGEVEKVQEMLGFEITPKFPVNLGLRKSYETLASMISQGYRIGPRTAFPELEAGAVCNHVMKTAVKYFLGLTQSETTQKLFDAVRRQNEDAWIFPATLEKEVGYIRVPEADLRGLFNLRFPSNRIAILSENKEAYEAGVKAQLTFLRTPEAVGSFVPTLYQHTGTASTVFGTFGGKEPNSHMFVNAAYNTTNDLTEIPGVTLEGSLGSKIDDILVALIRDYGGISGYRNASKSDILQALTHIHEFIDVQILINGEYKTLKFDAQLQILNSDDTIDLEKIESFRIGGSVMLDGYQITPNPKGGKKIIEQRLNIDWVVYMSHFLKNPIFHPTSILQVPPQMLDATAEGTIGGFASQAKIRKFIDIKKGQEVNDIYFEQIAQNMFQTSHHVLTDEQKAAVIERYQLHSLGLQLLGYHSFGGKAWTDGATNINAPIPFIEFDAAEDIGFMQELYKSFIQARRVEYIAGLKETCATDTFHSLPFAQIKVFPGDSKYMLMYYLSIQLEKTHPELYLRFQSLSFIDKEAIVLNLLGEEVFRGDLASGSLYTVGYDALEAAIELQILQSPDIPLLRNASGGVSPDKKIIDAVARTSLEKYMLSWTLILESYVDEYQGDSYFDKTYVWNLRDNHIYSRRAGKEYAHMAENMGVQDWFDSQNEDFWGQFPQSFVHQLQEKEVLDNEKKMRRISSLSDFQVRILYNMHNKNTHYKETWPGKNIIAVIDTLLENTGKYPLLFSEYPHSQKIDHDLAVLEQIKDIYLTDEASKRGGDIEKLLRSISQLDSGNQSNIVSKVFWSELLISIDQDNMHKIFQHILNSKHSMSDIDELGERFPLSLLLVRNMGPQKGLYLWAENYLQRFISHIDSSKDLPSIKTTQGLSNQTIYGLGTFMSHMKQYKEIIETLDIPDTQKETIIAAIDGIDMLNTENDIFNFFQNTKLQEIYASYNIENFILPTVDEFKNPKLFRYTAQMESVYKRRVHKPSLEGKDIAYPLMALFLFLQSFSTMTRAVIWNLTRPIPASVRPGIDITKKAYKGTEKVYKGALQVISYGKEVSRKTKNIMNMKQVFQSGNITQKNIDLYGVQRQKQIHGTNNILTSTYPDPQAENYRDGYYKIHPTEAINGLEYRPFTYQNDVVLTNDPEHPESVHYKDGNYIFGDAVTLIISDFNKKLHFSNIEKWEKQQEQIKKKDILLLRQKQIVDMDIAAE